MRALLVSVVMLGLFAMPAAAQEVRTKAARSARAAQLVPVKIDDGLKARTYWLDPAWEIEFSDAAPANGSAAKGTGGETREVAPGVWLRAGGTGTKTKGAGTPVSPAFRAGKRPASALMALPGGVIVRFRASLSVAQARAWLAAQGLEVVREFNLSAPTYEVASPAGMACIELARELLAQDEIEVASPNWWQEVAPN